MESIWFSQLDNRYDCRVTRTDQSHGLLTVTDTTDQRVLLSEAVELSYGAVYGPDIDDVAEWQDKCVAVVDDKT